MMLGAQRIDSQENYGLVLSLQLLAFVFGSVIGGFQLNLLLVAAFHKEYVYCV